MGTPINVCFLFSRKKRGGPALVINCYFRGLKTTRDSRPFCTSFCLQVHNVRTHPAVSILAAPVFRNIRHNEQSCEPFERLTPTSPSTNMGDLLKGGPPERKRWLVHSEAALRWYGSRLVHCFFYTPSVFLSVYFFG